MNLQIVIGATTLLAYTDTVYGLSNNGSPTIEAVPGVDQPSVTYLDRDNFTGDFTFAIEKEFASWGLAFEWFLEAPQTFNGIATVVITARNYDNSTIQFTRTNARVTVHTQQPVGVRAFGQVTITGGEFT